MTESGGRPDRLDVAALAELDAGLPDDDRAARARTAAAADPEAAAVLDALAATRAELAALPTPEVPPAVAARWAAALTTEARRHPDGPSDRHTVTSRGSGAAATRVPGPPGSPWRRVGRRAWPPLVAAAVLAAVVGTGLGALVHRPAPAVSRVELVALGRAAVGTMDVGDLADPAGAPPACGPSRPPPLGRRCSAAAASSSTGAPACCSSSRPAPPADCAS